MLQIIIYTPWRVRVIRLWWSTCPSTPFCYPSPFPRSQAPSISCLLLCPSTQLLTTWQTTGSLHQDIKKPRPLLNEGTLAALCSPCLSAGEQCPWPSCIPPSPSPISFHQSQLSVPFSGGLVRGATWRASLAWFIPCPSARPLRLAERADEAPAGLSSKARH